MVKVSVIIPVYNVAQYLEECLQSLAGQTLQNAEFLLVDDGSTDGSGAICDRWAGMDARFIAVHQENQGVSGARNRGLQIARGNYIGFADADDWLESNALELLSCLLDENPQAQMACAGYYEHLPDPGRTPLARPAARHAVHGMAGKEAALRNVMMRDGYFTAVFNKLFRRTFLCQNGCLRAFDTALHMGEDEVWLLTLLSESDCCVFSPVPVYHWRSRGDSITHQSKLTERRLSVLDAKKAAVSRMSGVSAGLEFLARSRLCNDTFDLRIFAYCAQEPAVMRRVRQAARGCWHSWLFSRDVPLLRKGKVILLLMMMWLRMPGAWVRKVNDLMGRQKTPS